MNALQNTKKVLVVNQAATTDAATASGAVDTAGFDHCTFSVYTTTSDAATNNLTVCTIAEGTNTTVSGHTNISGLVAGTDFTVPAAETAATNITGPVAVLHVNTHGREQFLSCSASPQTTQTITIIADLSRAEVGATNAAAQGADVIATV